MQGIDGEDERVLRPRELYEALGRSDEYRKTVERLKGEREEFLKAFPALSDEIVAAVRERRRARLAPTSGG